MRYPSSSPLVLIGTITSLLLFGCSDSDVPSSSRVILEIDRMEGMPPLQDEQTIDGRRISLTEIYRRAGIELEVVQDEHDLPTVDQVQLRDLHAIMTSFRSRHDGDGTRVHLLIATEEAGKPSDLGVMFDWGQGDVDGVPREGFAIFVTAHERLEGNLEQEMLLTAAHELAHVFNLHHDDWEGQSFKSGATIESYSLADSVIWSLSQGSLDHLRNHHPRLVWPGENGLAFAHVTEAHHRMHQSNPGNAYSIVDENDLDRVTRASAVPRSMAARIDGSLRTRDDHPLRLHLHAPKRGFVVGEPIVLTVGLHNDGTTPVSTSTLLNPIYRALSIEIRRDGSGHFELFRPAVLAEARNERAQLLGPGEAIHEEAKIFFGASGWTFGEAGPYAVRATFSQGDGGDRLLSNVIELTITEGQTAADETARRIILGPEQGLFLLLDGADHLQGANEKLKRIVREVPSAAHVPACKVALAWSALEPTLVPDATQPGSAKIEEAESYLADVLDTELAEVTLVRVQTELAEKLEQAGRTEDAERVREQTIAKLEGHESVQPSIDELKKRKP